LRVYGIPERFVESSKHFIKTHLVVYVHILVSPLSLKLLLVSVKVASYLPFYSSVLLIYFIMRHSVDMVGIGILWLKLVTNQFTK